MNDGRKRLRCARRVCQGERCRTRGRSLSGGSFVERGKFLEAERFAGISFDSFDDAFAADSAVIGNVVVHTAVLFRAEDAAGVHVAAFVNIDDVTVTGIENQMAPADFVHLTGQLKVVIPSQALAIQEFIDMRATSTTTCIDEGVVIDVFIREFAEPVASGLELEYTCLL